MKVLVTGSAGFIGYHTTLALIEQGHDVVGIDNINSYYDVDLKYGRLNETGIERTEIFWNKEITSYRYPSYRFLMLNLEDKDELMALCQRERFDAIINLAAQAGVRYSIINPDAYVQSNLVGFLNVLEASRRCHVKHLIYASSSSVYGLNERVPFSATHNTNHPVSLYAATKKANELMAHAYSSLYGLPTTGLRFFTVYGPWGRPDMAAFLFTNAIISGHPIKVFNKGLMKRDFTFVDDVVAGIVKVLEKPACSNGGWDGQLPDPATSSAPYCVFNIGNNQPVELLYFIQQLEQQLGKKASLDLQEMQAGDVQDTWADVDELITHFNYRPDTTIQAGLKKFVSWFREYYRVADYSKAQLNVV